ncbi:hypothetical protein DTL21_25280 [Bremerella cremea]|uniref:Uncharacterized protein n=1 Tax=Blastopirellula marina TaxID=124 RepID=A0A2S8FB53_9BACT|nr:hypothetical protein C5Y83_25235 [Blastopirellula marina]RCS42685.1 hypothetical protein DTL21_25280 [Bremerella cremea]
MPMLERQAVKATNSFPKIDLRQCNAILPCFDFATCVIFRNVMKKEGSALDRNLDFYRGSMNSIYEQPRP